MRQRRACVVRAQRVKESVHGALHANQISPAAGEVGGRMGGRGILEVAQSFRRCF